MSDQTPLKMPADITSCVCCGSSNLELLLDIPKLPLTGLYFNSLDDSSSSPLYDQRLLGCTSCGHAFLGSHLDPSFLYDNSYSHRSSTSPIAVNTVSCFQDKVLDVIGHLDNINLLEVGCNDGILLNSLASRVVKGIGIDPIWIDTPFENPLPGNIEIIGAYANQLQQILPTDFRPNLVVSSHAFEHISDVYSDLQYLLSISSDDAIFCIEIPSFDTLIKSSRIDQIFHQHLHYFSESSIRALVSRLQGDLISINYNYSTWGGTVFFSFKKSSSSRKSTEVFSLDDKTRTFDKFFSSLDSFKSHLREISSAIDKSEYSYLGAAQMLPIIHYYLKDFIDERQLKCVHDDNVDRIGKFLPHVPSVISPFDSVKPKIDSPSCYVVGAPDSTRPILRRTLELGLNNVFSTSLLMV